MFKITITDDGTIQSAIKKLDDIQRRQLPYATARALTKTAEILKEELRNEIGKVFDRPTPYALRSLRVIPATKAKLEAVVWLKDEWSVGTFGTPATKYLAPEIFGGSRSAKSSELALRRRGLLANDMFYRPAIGMPLDRYGNLPSGDIIQMLSSLGAMHDKWANQTARSMKRHRTPSEYFVMTTKGRTTPFGIWRRRGDQVWPFIHFIRSPNYKPRFKFFEVAERVAHRELPQQFHAAIKIALETAR